MRRRTLVLMMVIAGMAGSAAATPTISNATAKQRFPWNGKVDITYTLTGDVTAGLPAWNMPRLFVTASNRVDGTTYAAAASTLSGDTGTAEGTHHVIWDLNAQGIEFNSEDVVFTVAYTHKPKPYCVIDLSGGASASSHPVSYLADVPSGGWTDEYKTTKLVLRLIEPGTFMMGGSYQVTLTKSFYCGVFTVTQKQYELVTGSNPSYYKGDMRPVEQVSWNTIRGDSSTYNWPSSANVDSNSFVGRLQARTGLNFDLPTEAQWEYACRAGTTSKYNNGGDTEDDLRQLGRYSGNKSDGKGGYTDAHTKVGSYEPNAWGLYDMHGNVWEWCLDWDGNLSSGVTDPQGSSSGSERVKRGGSWGYYADGCTSSYRSYINPSGDFYVGFRLVRTLSNTEGERSPEAVAGAERADVLCAAEAAPVAIDSRTGVEPVLDSVILPWDAAWIGGDANATVVIADNGTEVRRTTGAGAFTHTLTGGGRHELTYTTYIGGVAQDEVYTATVYGKWKYEVVDGGAVITETTQTSGAVTIPAEIDGYPVRDIADGLFAGCSSLTGVTIPDGVTHIGASAFAGCSNLTEVVIPGSVWSIGEGVFAGCANLRRVEAPRGLKGMIEANDAFAGCPAGLEIVYVSAEITGVTTKQRYPWNGKVDITYTLTGDVTAGLPAWNMPRLFVTASNRVDGTIYAAAASALSGDTGTAEGAHHVVWDMNAQGLEIKSDEVSFAVGYTPIMRYCVVDLSGGANASSYPVSYLADVPSGGWTDEYKTTKLVLRLIEPGTFMMNGAYSTTLTKPFYCGVFEVTQKQYELVTGGNPSSYKGDMRPVEYVSWNTIRGNSSTYNWPNSAEVDPNSFMGRLQARTGLNFDLPTEAQWEYACRAGTTSKYNNGGDTENDLKQLGRYSGNQSDGKGGYSQHTKVGSYLPNVWGLYDMHGNVEEWCLDWWYESLSSTATDPVGPSSGSRRMLRGGSWRDSRGADFCSSLFRDHNGPSSNSYEGGYGFRLVRTLSNTDGERSPEAVAGAERADALCAAEAAPVAIDSRVGVEPVLDSVVLPWDAAWIGGDANATVVITDSGTEVKRTTGAGEWVYQLSGLGLHHLTYTTYIGGVVQSEVYEADVFLKGHVADESISAVLLDADAYVYDGTAKRPAYHLRDTTRDPDLNVAVYAPGDVDGDGVLTSNDVLLMQRYIAYLSLSDAQKERFASYNLTGDALAAADANGDGAVDANDVAWMQTRFECYDMVEGTDYTVAYSDNVNAGTGKLTITGMGNYGGTVTLTFTIARATIGADGEPGAGEVPEGGVSKYDAAFVYDGLGHVIDTNGLASIRVDGKSPAISYSLDGAEGWQTAPFVFTNACVTSVWYRLEVPNFDDYVHEALVTIAPKSVADASVETKLLETTFLHDGTAHVPAASVVDSAVFRWQYVTPFDAGDVDGDGVLTYDDMDLIDQHVAYLGLGESVKPLFEEFALTGAALAAADVNGDGEVDAADMDALELRFRTLAEGVDYVVVCLDNVAVGTATAVVTGIGNYTGTVERTFEITLRNIAGAAVTLDDALTYTGTAQTQAVAAVTVDGVPATFTVSGNVGADAGEYELTVTGTGNFTGTETVRWAIAARDIAGAEVTLGDALVYDGTEQTQGVASVTVDGLSATFTVSGNTATAAGDYVLTVTGTGNFTGTVTKEWMIARARIVASAQPYDGVYDGEGHGIAVEVASPEGAAVTYSVAEAGPYSQGAILFTNVLVAATTVWYRVEAANYVGASGSAQVSIAPRSITNAVVSVAGSVAYAGAAARPSVTVTDEGTTGLLVEGVDYTLAYADNEAVGMASVTVTGIGNYAGAQSVAFEIVKGTKRIENTATGRLSATAFTFDGQEKSVAYVSDGVLPDETVDVSLTGTTNAVHAGTYTAVANGVIRGFATDAFYNYVYETTLAGVAFEWTIAPHGAEGLDVALGSAAYDHTGLPVEADVTVTDVARGATLAEGADYVLEYVDNVRVGVATVRVCFTNDYVGTVERTFRVVPSAEDLRNVGAVTLKDGSLPVAFELGLDCPWWSDEGEISYDGTAAMKSGAIGGGETSWMKGTFEGAGIFEFSWKASCESDAQGVFGRDHAECLLDGVVVAQLDGVTGWTRVLLDVRETGAHEIEWRYVKDASDAAAYSGADCAWVDGIKFSSQVRISFAAGGADGDLPGTLFSANGYSVTLPEMGNLRLAKHTFAGWADDAGVHAAGATYEVGATDTVLTASWTAKVVPTPVITAPERYDGITAEVSIADADGNAAIYYTLDGSEPSATNGTLYAGAFAIEGTITIKAIAVRDDYFDSSVSMAESVRSWGTLNECLDNTELVFTTGGDAPWLGTVAVSHVGVSSARSGAIGDLQNSWIETTVTNGGTVSFWWKASSEVYKKTPIDILSFSVDGIEMYAIGGVTEWEEITVDVTGPGVHTLRWEYVKDEADSAGEDCGWLDQVAWTPAVAPYIIVDAGDDKTVSVPRTWIEGRTALVEAANGDAEAAVRNGTAANGRKVWECYVFGLDPEDATSDFRITLFPMKANGTPDIGGMTVDPPPSQWNVSATWKVKGAATLAGPWEDVSAGGGSPGTARPTMRFFKVEVVLP